MKLRSAHFVLLVLLCSSLSLSEGLSLRFADEMVRQTASTLRAAGRGKVRRVEPDSAPMRASRTADHARFSTSTDTMQAVPGPAAQAAMVAAVTGFRR